MLEIDVSLSLAEFAVEPQIEAAPGITVLFGPSGSGKSLTLQCVAGLVRPDRGRIVVDHRVLFDSTANIDLPPQLRRVGYVPQDYALFPHLAVARNIAFGLDGWPRRQVQQTIDEMLALMGLSGMADRHPADLSGGEQQRVALARALVRRPEVLLLDEPFAALDGPVRTELRQQVRELQRRFGLPALFVTHDLSEASFIADRLAIFIKGRVHQIGLPNEVLMRPADLQVARAVGVKNILAGRVVEWAADHLMVRVAAALLTTPAYPFEAGASVNLCIRPERILFQRKDRPSRNPVNQLDCRIVAETSDGLNCTLFLDTESSLHPLDGITDLQVDLPVYIYERLGLSRGQAWSVSIPPGAIHVIDAAQE